MLSDGEHQFLARQRIAHLATADSRAVPHVVPVCFAILDRTLYITIDEKPKRLSGTPLKRLRNIAENPAVAVVVDRYDEDWARLGWVMLHGHARNSGRRNRTPGRAGAATFPLPTAQRDADCKVSQSSPSGSNERQAGATCPWARRPRVRSGESGPQDGPRIRLVPPPPAGRPNLAPLHRRICML